MESIFPVSLISFHEPLQAGQGGVAKAYKQTTSSP